MKKTIIISALSMLSLSATAEILSPADALYRALYDGKAKIHALDVDKPLLKHSFIIDGAPVGYVFSVNNDGEGFIIVSADDVAAPVLGFSDEDCFDPANIPPSMEWWMRQYSQEMQYARETGLSYDEHAFAASKSNITPLLKTKWNQDAPYNNDCPEINNVRCVTGCVATAMAQVMNYHKWPATGTGSNSYITSGSTKIPVSYDFAKANFDWDNMANSYETEQSDKACAAVANLMYACGVSVNMGYTPLESAAYDFSTGVALIKYFKYDKGARYFFRKNYGREQWKDLIYDQLVNYGPVIYSGSNSDSGHSFVCDGYRDGYYHFNWGWGGMSDGYYLITSLNPLSQGIGGSTSGYDSDQTVVGCIKPQSGNSSLGICFTGNNMYIPASTINLGTNISVEIDITNYSFDNVDATVGVKLLSESGKETFLSYGSVNFPPMNYLRNIQRVQVPSSLSEGEYTVTPAVKVNNVVYDVEIPISAVRSYKMTVSGKKATFAEVPAPKISVSSLAMTPLYIYSDYKITGKISNPNPVEYLGSIHAVITDANDKALIVGNDLSVSIDPYTTEDFTYISEFRYYNANDLVTGKKYYIYMVDAANNKVSDVYAVELLAQQSLSITVNNLAIVDADRYEVKADNFKLSCDVNCKSGYLAKSLDLFFFNESLGTSISYLKSQPLFIEAGHSDVAVFSGDMSAVLLPGKTYVAAIYYGNNQLSMNFKFKIAEEDGISDVIADKAPASVKIYGLDGREFVNENLLPGHYIKVSTLADGSVETEHFIVK